MSNNIFFFNPRVLSLTLSNQSLLSNIHQKHNVIPFVDLHPYCDVVEDYNCYVQNFFLYDNVLGQAFLVNGAFTIDINSKKALFEDYKNVMFLSQLFIIVIFIVFFKTLHEYEKH